MPTKTILETTQVVKEQLSPQNWDFNLTEVSFLETEHSEYAPWCSGQGGCDDNPSCHFAPCLEITQTD